jgi:hypothetical protein
MSEEKRNPLEERFGGKRPDAIPEFVPSEGFSEEPEPKTLEEKFTQKQSEPIPDFVPDEELPEKLVPSPLPHPPLEPFSLKPKPEVKPEPALDPVPPDKEYQYVPVSPPQDSDVRLKPKPYIPDFIAENTDNPQGEQTILRQGQPHPSYAKALQQQEERQKEEMAQREALLKERQKPAKRKGELFTVAGLKILSIWISALLFTAIIFGSLYLAWRHAQAVQNNIIPPVTNSTHP